MAAAKLLERLAGVRQTKPGHWIAKCPAHEDRTPSLSIRELDDGRTLLHCFAGCDVGAVLDALGLTLADLFPARLPQHSYALARSRLSASDLLEILDHEVTVAALILSDVLRDHAVDESQWVRLAQAAARIGKARDHGRA